MGDDEQVDPQLVAQLVQLLKTALPYLMSAGIAISGTLATHRVESATDEASHATNAEQVQANKAAIEAEAKERKAELEKRRKERDAQIRALEDRVLALETIVERLDKK